MRILAVGDLILDTLVLPAAPLRLDTDNRAQISTNLGGAATNFATWVAALGTDVQLVARVGAADVEVLGQELSKRGVVPKLQSDSKLQTGKIVVLVQGNQRTFLTDRGANVNLDIDPIIGDDLGELLYLSGYSILDIGIDGAQRLFAAARERGVKIAVDPGSAGFIADYGTVDFLNAIAGADYLFPNLQEARLLSGVEDVAAAAEVLHQSFQNVVITLGEDGCYIKDQQLAEFVPGRRVNLVDPTGAGDAFAAGYLAAVLKGATTLEAAREANHVASMAVQIVGASALSQANSQE